jgi:hypothetical protein
VPALTCKHAGLAHGDASPSFTGGLATGATGGSNVGTYAVTQGALAATGRYTVGTFHQGALTVDPASLAVAADNQAMIYGGGVPALTCKHTGPVSGGAGASFSGGLATAVTSGCNVGTYDITLGTLSGWPGEAAGAHVAREFGGQDGPERPKPTRGPPSQGGPIRVAFSLTTTATGGGGYPSYWRRVGPCRAATSQRRTWAGPR